LNQGKLFQVEKGFFAPLMTNPQPPTRRTKRRRRVEHYWLCDQCSPILTLIYEKSQGMQTVPLPGSSEK
jgi:hypothetical protein